jgi:hypothetical protein
MSKPTNIFGDNNICWCPFPERNPNRDGKYFVTTWDGCIEPASYFKDDRAFYQKTDKDEWQRIIVTAWSPLPKPHKSLLPTEEIANSRP